MPCLCKQCRSRSVGFLEKPTDLNLHCFTLSIWVCINNLDQIIWLAENNKWVWHLSLFRMARVKKECTLFWDFSVYKQTKNTSLSDAVLSQIQIILTWLWGNQWLWQIHIILTVLPLIRFSNLIKQKKKKSFSIVIFTQHFFVMDSWMWRTLRLLRVWTSKDTQWQKKKKKKKSC